MSNLCYVQLDRLTTTMHALKKNTTTFLVWLSLDFSHLHRTCRKISNLVGSIFFSSLSSNITTLLTLTIYYYWHWQCPIALHVGLGFSVFHLLELPRYLVSFLLLFNSGMYRSTDYIIHFIPPYDDSGCSHTTKCVYKYKRIMQFL